MSFEQDPRRGPRRPVVQRRRRGALAPTLALIGVLIVLSLLLTSVWTDVLWYDQLGFLTVYRTEVLTQGGLFIAGAALMAGVVLGALMLAYRSRPVYAPVSADQGSIDRYRESIEPLRRLVVIAVPAGLALFAGSAASQQWQTFLLWWNRVPFGRDDAQFHLDIGFFVFTLPWLEFLQGFLTAVVFLAALASLVTHYLYGGIRLQGGKGPRLTAAARGQLASFAAAFLLLRGIEYWLGRYALSTSSSRLITGLTYTDARATLTAQGVLAAIATIVAILFLVAAFVERSRMLPVYGVALLVVSALLVGVIYPAVVQRFQVKPSESTLEQPYIQRNIAATRDAYGLTAVDASKYQAKTQATAEGLRSDAASVPGIRLLDPSVVSPTFRQLQQNKQYYSFADSLDIDRYKIDGKQNDTVIAVRELDLDKAPAAQRGWVNDHVVYTHGFGVVAAYGSQQQSDGKPSFFQGGIPSTGKLGDYEPRIYFGEQSPEYSIVGGPSSGPERELDYPDGKSADSQQNNTYSGTGGVSIGSEFNRLMYALKFREQNILLSDAVNAQSRIMYDRTPRERVEKVAPYLTLDGDPYPAVVNGRVTWILDGYTTTDKYPYSSTSVLNQVTSDSITQSRQSVVALQDAQVNYIRNSVKATVDAFDGSVTLYAWDDQDPILKAWQRIFPSTVQPLSKINGSLMSHMRYPEDLFKVQRSMLATYHVTQANAFYTQQDYWQVPDDPTDAATSVVQQPPFYLTLQMPKQDSARFSLTSTFIPRQGQSVLTGFLAADSDAGDQDGVRRPGYGQLRLLQLPEDAVLPGPGQVQNNFNADPTVNTQLNLLRRGNAASSSVKYGNLLTLPVGGGLLYVEPVYVSGAGGSSYPLLQKVLVAFGDKIGFADTLSEALDQVFGAGTTPSGTGTGTPGGGGGSGTGTTGPSVSASPGASGSPGPPATGSGNFTALQQALQDANQALKDSDAALRSADLTAYAAAQKRLRDAVDRAVAAQSAGAAVPGATPSATSKPGATG